MKNKKKKRLLVVEIIAIIALLIIVIIISKDKFSKKNTDDNIQTLEIDTDEEITIQKDEGTGEKTEKEAEKEAGEKIVSKESSKEVSTEVEGNDVAQKIAGTNLIVERINSYDGIYIEDGSDTEITDISAMILKN